MQQLTACTTRRTTDHAHIVPSVNGTVKVGCVGLGLRGHSYSASVGFRERGFKSPRDTPATRCERLRCLCIGVCKGRSPAAATPACALRDSTPAGAWARAQQI